MEEDEEVAETTLDAEEEEVCLKMSLQKIPQGLAEELAEEDVQRTSNAIDATNGDNI